MSLKYLKIIAKYDELVNNLLLMHSELMQVLLENETLFDKELLDRITKIDKTDKYMKEYQDLLLLYDGD